MCFRPSAALAGWSFPPHTPRRGERRGTIKCFDRPACADAPPTAYTEHALQLGAQGCEPVDSTLDFHQMASGQSVYPGAGLIRLRTKRQQFADGRNFKAQVARMT